MGASARPTRIHAWSRPSRGLEREGADGVTAWAISFEQAAGEHLADSGEPIDMDRYNAIGSIEMNARGLSRYWRKRWEREAETAAPQGAPSSASPRNRPRRRTPRSWRITLRNSMAASSFRPARARMSPRTYHRRSV